MSTKFKQQHGHMVALAETILGVARDKPADAAAQLTRARLALSREIADHCGTEVKVLNARRDRVRGAAADALIRRYHDELLRWRHDLIACNSAWPPARVLDDGAGFQRAFFPIAAALRERVRWEEEEFYPAVLYPAAA